MADNGIDWSVSSLRVSAAALAQLKAPEALEPILKRLPGDCRPVWHMDAAGALAQLGDPRAVPYLIRVANLSYTQPPALKDDPMNTAFGRRMNRFRAALALGSFDSRDVRVALSEGLSNPDVSLACHAALFRLTKENGHYEVLEKTIRDGDGLDVYLLSDYLEKLHDPRAKELAENARNRLESERGQ